MAERIRFFAQRKTFIFIMVATYILSSVANLYRWVNNTAMHDGLQLNMEGDVWWQYALGRFMVPLYEAIRGFICSPFTIGILATLFIGLLVYVLIRCLDITSPLLMLAIAAVFSANAVLVHDYGWYTQFSDIQMCAYCLSALSVYVVLLKRRMWPAAFICLFIAIGLYQASLMFAAALVLIVMIKQLLSSLDLKQILAFFVRMLVVAFVALVLYFICAHTIIKIVNWGEISYDAGLNNMRAENFFDIGRMAATFIIPILYLFHPQTHLSVLIGIGNGLLMIGMIISCIVIGVKQSFRPSRWLLLLLCMILLPCAMTCFYWFTKDPLYERMILSVFLFYPLCAVVVERLVGVVSANRTTRPHKTHGNIIRNFAARVKGKNKVHTTLNERIPVRIVACFLIVIFACAALYSNQVYLRKDLENEARLSLMTRIADRMDATPGYKPGTTQVAFIGNLDDNTLYRDVRPAFAPQASNRSAFLEKHTELYMDSLVHEETIGWGQYCYLWYFHFYLGYPIAIVEDTSALAANPEVQALPSFPSSECCKMVDGKLVVKLS